MARNEAIEAVTAAGVSTMTPVAFREQGSNPARQHSFIIPRPGATVSLELLPDWRENHPAGAQARTDQAAWI